MSEFARDWRTKEQRLRLKGDICPGCDTPRFPPGGQTCPRCAGVETDGGQDSGTNELGMRLVTVEIGGNGHH